MIPKKKQTGNLGEDIAAEYLQRQGYIIEARNWRTNHFEIDIIASKEQLLHFIEVKTRYSLRFGYPEASISYKKMCHLKKAAAIYQYQHSRWKYIQFDAISITLETGKVKELILIEDMFL